MLTPSAVNFSVTSSTIPGATGVGIAGNGDIIAGGTISNAGLLAGKLQRAGSADAL